MAGLLDWWRGTEGQGASPLDGAPLYYPPEVRAPSADYVGPLQNAQDVRGLLHRELEDPGLGGRIALGFGENVASVGKAAARAAPLAEEVAGSHGLLGQGQRGMAGVPNLRTMSSADAQAVAAREPHLIPGPDGQYVGAPRGVDSRRKLNVNRKAFDADVAAGAEGGDWYSRARAWNETVAGPNPYRQRLIAHEQALWSAQADPNTNMAFQLQGHNAYERGTPAPLVRTGQQARAYNDARLSYDAQPPNMGHNGGPPLEDAPLGLPRLGPKTGIYGQHLDPTVPYATTGTNDIWHARGMGYKGADGEPFSRALGSTEHAFLDYETMLAVARANKAGLGGRSNWTAAEIQAAPWVAGKGRGLVERAGVDPKTGAPRMTQEEGLRRASMTYPDYAPQHTFHSTSEQIPGASTGLLPGLLDADMATRQAFTNRAGWGDELGRDRIHADMGFWTQPSVEGVGAYRNAAGGMEHNPVSVGRPLVDTVPNPVTGLPETHPGTLQALQGGEAARGLLDFQEGAAGNRVNIQGSGPGQTSLAVNLGRMPTQAEMAQLDTVAGRHGLTMGNADNGVNMLNYRDPEALNPLTGQPFGPQTTAAVGKDLRGGLQRELQEAVPGSTVQRGRGEGVYVNFAEGNAIAYENRGQGKATTILLDELEKTRVAAPAMYEKLLDSAGVQGKARANLDRLWESGGAGHRPDYEELLKIVGEGKLRGLLDRVAKLGVKGLPAAGGLGLTGGLLAPDEPTGGAR